MQFGTGARFVIDQGMGTNVSHHQHHADRLRHPLKQVTGKCPLYLRAKMCALRTASM